jgi:hypothetical protein
MMRPKIMAKAWTWGCPPADPENPEHMTIAFRAGAGGLHSAEN